MAQAAAQQGAMLAAGRDTGVYTYSTPAFTASASSPDLLLNAVQGAQGAAAQGAANAAALNVSAGPNPNILRPVPPTTFARYLGEQIRALLVTEAPWVSDTGPISIYGLVSNILTAAPDAHVADLSSWGATAKADIQRILGRAMFYEQSPENRIREEIEGSPLWFDYLRGAADHVDVEFVIGLYRPYPYKVTIPSDLVAKMNALIDGYVQNWPTVRLQVLAEGTARDQHLADWTTRANAVVAKYLGSDATTIAKLADKAFGNPYGAISYLASTKGNFSDAGYLQYEFDVNFNQYYNGAERQYLIDPFFNAIRAATAAANTVPFSAGQDLIFSTFKNTYEKNAGHSFSSPIQSHEGVLDPAAEYQAYINTRLQAEIAQANTSTDLSSTFRQNEVLRLLDLFERTIFPQLGVGAAGAGSPTGTTYYIDTSQATPYMTGRLASVVDAWNDFMHQVATGALDGFKKSYDLAVAILGDLNAAGGTRFA